MAEKDMQELLKPMLSKVKIGNQIYYLKDTEARNAVNGILNDYLKAADKVELQGLITAEKGRAEGVEAGLATRLATVEDDYLKASDKTELDGKIQNNTNAINVLNGGVEVEGSVAKKIATEIGKLHTIELNVVTSLPEAGDAKYIYLVKPEGSNTYEEYVWIASLKKFEKIGDTDIALKDYFTKAEVNAELAKKVDKETGKSLVTDSEITKLAGITSSSAGDGSITVGGVTVSNYNDTALADRVSAVESEFEASGRVPTVEGAVNTLKGRVDTAEGNIDTLEGYFTNGKANTAVNAEQLGGHAASEYELKENLGDFAYLDEINVTVDSKEVEVGGQVAHYAGQVIQGVKATGSLTGSVTISDKDATVSSTGTFTPEGTISAAEGGSFSALKTATFQETSEGGVQIKGTVSAPDIKITQAAAKSVVKNLTGGKVASFVEGVFTPASIDESKFFSAGSQASYSHSGFSGGSLGNAQKAEFATAGLVAEVDNDECLIFTAAAKANAVTEQGAFTAAVYGTDNFVANTLPSINVLEGFKGGSKAADTFVANELQGVENENIYEVASAALANAPVFTGNSYNLNTTVDTALKSVVFAGTSKEVSVSGTYKAVATGSQTVTANNVELSVGDINVSGADLTTDFKKITVAQEGVYNVTKNSSAAAPTYITVASESELPEDKPEGTVAVVE